MCRGFSAQKCISGQELSLCLGRSFLGTKRCAFLQFYSFIIYEYHVIPCPRIEYSLLCLQRSSLSTNHTLLQVMMFVQNYRYYTLTQWSLYYNCYPGLICVLCLGESYLGTNHHMVGWVSAQTEGAGDGPRHKIMGLSRCSAQNHGVEPMLDTKCVEPMPSTQPLC